MILCLGIASSCTSTGCQVQFLDGDVRVHVGYSDPVVNYGITIRPGDLVAVDRAPDRPLVVYRWILARVERVEHGRVYADDACTSSEPLTLTEDLEAEVAVGDKVFVAYGKVHDVAINGRPAHPEHLRESFFPEIQAMYQRPDAWKDMDPKQTVEEGYDLVAERYLDWIQTGRLEERARYTSILFDELSPGDKVLDLGCGAGLPTTQQLARRFDVTGVDFSARQLALARKNAPEAELLQADMTELDFETASFAAVTSFYALIHVPREEQPKLLRDIASWLRPGGLLVATMSTESVNADFGGFFGAAMYWSGFDVETNVRLVEEAGLRIISAREETAIEFGKPVTFLWVVARKPAA